MCQFSKAIFAIVLTDDGRRPRETIIDGGGGRAMIAAGKGWLGALDSA